MAKVLDLPAIPPFSVAETSSLAQRWDKWTKSLEYYIRTSGISDQKQKRAILLHLAGAEVQEIFETLPETGDDYKTALEKLTAHFNSCKNIAFERHVFQQATQKADETMDAYVTRLRNLSKTCEFGTSLHEMIRDQIIEKCASTALRRRLLRERELTLDNLLLIARSFELADRQALEIEQKFDSSTHLNSIEQQSESQQSRRNSAKRDSNNRLKSVCYCCALLSTKPVDVVASLVILLGSVAKQQENPRTIGRMLASFNNPTTTHLKTNVCLLLQPTMYTIARTAFIRN